MNELRIKVAVAVLTALVAGGVLAAEAGSAEKLYVKSCQSCHGADGKGAAKMAKMLKVELAALNLVDVETQKDSDDQLTTEIADGVNKKMPAYGKKLTALQIKDLV